MEDLFLLFENYLAGNLPPKEKEDFELQLQNDISFNTQFNNYKETHHFLENKFKNISDKKDFKQNLEKISDDYFKQKDTSKNKFWYVGIAASIAVLISVFLWNPATPNYDDYRTYPDVSFTERGSETALLKNAENAFNKKDFTKANTLFSELLKNEPNNNEFKLYKSFSLIELNRFKEADKILEELSKGNTSYQTQATWYLALSKLKQKEYNTCRTLLKQIPENAVFYKKAKKLTDKLPN